MSNKAGMDYLQTPQSQETKDFLEKELGLKPFAPTKEPNFANPDKIECKSTCHTSNINFCIDHIFSAVILAASFGCRQYARTIGLPTIPFTFSILCVPAFYFLSIHHKEKRFNFGSGERKTFEQNLEFYPVTRRAWNRAVAIHEGGAPNNQ